MAALITHNAGFGARLKFYDPALTLDHIVFQAKTIKIRKKNQTRVLAATHEALSTMETISAVPTVSMM